MIYVEPDFYEEFTCIADQCRHSCCIGWEIDIDRETAEYYDAIPGELGERLRRCIGRKPETHFILTSGERCPMLNAQGLCELILMLGEESLCDICREHPRFYTCFPEREERGLGLCCEEAARLLLRGTEPLRFLSSGDGEEETPALIMRREEIFACLGAEEKPLAARMQEACRLMETELIGFDFSHWRKFYLGLERLEEEWTAALESADGKTEAEGAAYERLAEYFVYRHFAGAESQREAAARLQFCFLSVRMIAALGGNLEEITRRYSAEIEYSDENMQRIMDEIERMEKTDA